MSDPLDSDARLEHGDGELLQQRLFEAHAATFIKDAAEGDESSDTEEGSGSVASESNSTGDTDGEADAEAQALLASLAWGEVCEILCQLPLNYFARHKIRCIHRDCKSMTAQLVDELFGLQRFAEAKTLGCKALRAHKICSEEPHLGTIPLVMKLADCYRELQQFPEAEKLFLQVLQTLKQHNGGERSLAYVKAKVILAGLHHRSLA